MYGYIPYVAFMTSKYKEEIALALAIHPTTRALGLKYLNVILKETVRYNARVIARMAQVTYTHFRGQPFKLTPQLVTSGMITVPAVAGLMYASQHEKHKGVPGALMGGAGFGPGVDPKHITGADSPREAVLGYWGLPDLSNLNRSAQLIHRVLRRR